MDHEDGQDLSKDKFYRKGRKIVMKERQAMQAWQEMRERRAAEEEDQRNRNRDVELLQGKLKREELKRDLFAYLRE
jgi:hypothetical protein